MHSQRVGVPQGSPSDKWLSAKRRKWIPFKPALTGRAVRAERHHPNFEQELLGLGFEFRRSDHRHSHSGSLAALLDDHQHPPGEL